MLDITATRLSLLQQYAFLKPIAILSETERCLVLTAYDSSRKCDCVLKISLTSILNNEADCLFSLDHPNIIRPIQYFRLENDCSVLQLEKAKGRSLLEFLLQEGALELAKVVDIVSQIISALESIHESGWIHRDVKPENLVYDPHSNKVILIDFEFCSRWSKDSERLLDGSLGTYEYSSPEIRRGAFYRGPEVDLWSFGVTIYVMLFRKFPFTKNQLASFTEILCFPTEGPSEQPLAPLKWKRILTGLMEIQGSKRIGLLELKKQVLDPQQISCQPSSRCQKALSRFFGRRVRAQE